VLPGDLNWIMARQRMTERLTEAQRERLARAASAGSRSGVGVEGRTGVGAMSRGPAQPQSPNRPRAESLSRAGSVGRSPARAEEAPAVVGPVAGPLLRQPRGDAIPPAGSRWRGAQPEPVAAGRRWLGGHLVRLGLAIAGQTTTGR
jgi:hypothetical protein